MNRRAFVKTTSMAAAVAVVSPSFAFGKRTRKQIGVQLYSVRDELKAGLDSVLGRLAGIGYQQIEMFGYNKGSYFGNDIASTAAMLKKYGLGSPSAHVGLSDFLHKGNDDECKQAAADAKALGNKYLVVPYLDANYRKTADDYRRIAARLNRAGEICQSYGMKFAYHNHSFEFDSMGSQTGYDILLAETDPKLVKMELDLYWVYNAGKDPLALFAAHPGRFVMWHVKDMDKSDKNKQTEIGAGVIDFKAIFAKAKQSGLEYFYVEQENYTVSPFDSMEKCFRYVKEHLV
jgi:sugar phosphate isomerase/epimerase